MTRFITLAFVTAFALAGVGMAQAAKSIGTAAAVNQPAKAARPGEAPRTLYLGNDLVFQERIDTTGKGLVQVLLVDGTTLTVGPGSLLTIDEFIYDPGTGTGKLAISFGKGAMRFIGGRLSKKQAAVIKTPAGTLAIRGAAVNAVVDGQKIDAAFLYGEQMTFTGANGSTQTVYEPGNTLHVASGSVTVAPTTAGDVKLAQAALAPDPASNGGAAEVPTNTSVEQSPITAANSAVAPSQAGSTEIQQVVLSTSPEEVQAEVINDVSVTANPGPGPAGPRTYQLRALSAPDPSYFVNWGPVINNPGPRGLVGGTAGGADEVVSAQQTASTTLTVTDGINTIAVPFSSSPGSYPVSFTDFDGDTLTGTMFVGANADFLFYSLFGPLGKVVYPFGGVPTPAAGLQGGDRLLIYDLLPDAQQGIAMPFMLERFAPDAQNASVSPLYLMAPDGNTIGAGRSAVLLGSLLINGQGTSQNSAVSVLVGDFYTDAGQVVFGSGNRGSVREASNLGSLVKGGGIISAAGPEGASIYGPNANNFVLSHNFVQDDALTYNDARFGAEYDFEAELVFGATHVADQVGSQQQATLTRSDKTYTGYAAGMLESQQYYGNNNSPIAIAYRSTDIGLTLDFTASQDTIGAQMSIDDVQSADVTTQTYNFGFGNSTVTGGEWRGVYVDDDRYAATKSNDPTASNVVTDSDGTFQVIDDAGGSGNFAYLMGSELAPQTGYFSAGNAPCVCKFLEWGFWGTKIEWIHTDHSHTDNFHLGTWVAGDVTNEIDMPTGGTASYSGFAVGNVARDIGGVINQYVAGGGFDMSWDFAARSGVATVSDFDGFTVSGAMNATSLAASASANTFSGGLTGGGLTGGLDGSFVGGPLGSTQGVIGSFDLTGAGFTATGIVAGEQP